ncbi:unnamed protein product [Prorocentrum cordatum]|uniref:Cytochrome b5 heme-binding domain-containing protein n=1 Tax=Prorocentrum cordatum TaxID=2364126 RepID=A0ABN9UJW2_9DINO|nr:unnamed protein product [Polarella glacialis]
MSGHRTSDWQLSPARASQSQAGAAAPGPGAGAAAPPGISGEQRLQVVEEMLELCRKAHAEARSAAPDGSREAPRAPAAKLPATYRQPVGVIGTADLARFGCSSDRMLVSCYGDIFDVSGRPDLYGSGKLSWHAGKDITWVVVTGDETPGNCNRFYDIFKLDQDRLARFMQIICWKLVSLEDEFGEPVGRLEPFMKEDELPPPPEGPAQECRQQ